MTGDDSSVAGRVEAWLARRVAPAARWTDPALRWGLGLTILLAGAHKAVAPGPWSAYAAPWVAALWPLPMDPTMRVNGLVEVVFGLALLADYSATTAAGVVAVSMLGVLVNLLTAGPFPGPYVDVAVRDFGLFVLAVGVTLGAAERRAAD